LPLPPETDTLGVILAFVRATIIALYGISKTKVSITMTVG
jgi:hypothetical protein